MKHAEPSGDWLESEPVNEKGSRIGAEINFDGAFYSPERDRGIGGFGDVRVNGPAYTGIDGSEQYFFRSGATTLNVVWLDPAGGVCRTSHALSGQWFGDGLQESHE